MAYSDCHPPHAWHPIYMASHMANSGITRALKHRHLVSTDVDAFPSPATAQGPPVPAYIRTAGVAESQSAIGSGGGNTSPAGGNITNIIRQRATNGVISSRSQHSAIKEVQSSLARKCNLVKHQRMKYLRI